ncbi:putative ribosomal protein arginine N-methytransferase rmt3 [Xylona heveae TC161]|uniref:type I protein arginine methyltransferase n=1 Tax=Xylona heveae (strain CBS 132557 / TC161) TaxID=1328760 RepID=A0A165IQB0_XYLHT|nr:putative ribosomal protein arginine N-methytransferase rmt3 [Xylona heveae TC161]KZF25228.1 putative ribosomal protein arginine N-methytransferase rmt3 [Xylona heveae TC161]
MSSPPSSSSESHFDPLDLRGEEGWEDVEPDNEEQSVVSLFSDEVFPDVRSMLQHCREKYNFDLVKVRKDLDLDFYGTIKLVNYIRSQTKAGNVNPDVSSKKVFEDDRYMTPILEDDAVLFELDDILDEPTSEQSAGAQASGLEPDVSGKELDKRVKDLEEELEKVTSQFDQYKLLVKDALADRYDDNDTKASLETSGSREPAQDKDAGYFTSYAYNDIHETMLKDTIRTDAYRDFIYENKDLFKGKVVLDVGCGTGILSMFCAKAGAKKVIAVDNSDVLDKARQNIFENGLGDVITCVRGKIEEVTLPVPKVDIIVSEWMGYCLLYEAMLDSVLYARDRYLAPGGLMVPSHMTIHVAPLADPEYIESHISFWHSVYGFSMSAMLDKIYDEVKIRCTLPKEIASDSSIFVDLPLHSVTTKDLSFRKPFSVTLSKDIDALDGWVIWFDTFFLRSQDAVPPKGARAEAWPTKPGTMNNQDGVAFTTGPHAKETHWAQGVLLIDHNKKRNSSAGPLKEGQKVAGTISFQKREDNPRELDIGLDWATEGAEEKGSQLWFMR